jgi:hypothetical protein
MAELTLEALAKRIEAIEQKMAEQAEQPPTRKKDWQRVVGMFTGSEFMKQVDAEGQTIREAERKAALEESES